MAGIRQTFDQDGKPHPKYRFWYIDAKGKRVWGTGTADPKETLRIARRLEDEQIRIKLNYVPEPKACDKPRSFAETAKEYLDWGASQGGHGGRPWSSHHLEMRRRQLAFWLERLGITSIQEVTLPAVEAGLRDLQRSGRDPKNHKKRVPMTGKALHNYSDSIHAFCRWAKARKYLAADPLEGLARFDITPKRIRRALTVEEIQKVLDAAETPDDRLLFEVALCTGYRRGELRALQVKDFSPQRGTVSLPAALTKGRKDAVQPIPAQLVEKLTEVANHQQPTAPLLRIHCRPHERLYRALARAGVPKDGPEGRVDFHALRVAYATLVIESGATVKEAQTLLRHSTPNLTMNVYARARQDRLVDVTKQVGRAILERTACATGVQREGVAKTQAATTTSGGEPSEDKKMVGAQGLEPRTSWV
jgi:integrase